MTLLSCLTQPEAICLWHSLERKSLWGRDCHLQPEVLQAHLVGVGLQCALSPWALHTTTQLEGARDLHFEFFQYLYYIL